MDFQGVVSNPYFKPEGSGRMQQLQSESSVEEDEELEQGVSSDADFIMSLKTFANAYELELNDLIQDLNTELERVSINNDEADGDVQVDHGGGDGGGLEVAGEVVVPCRQVSSEDQESLCSDGVDMRCSEVAGEVDRILLCRQASSEEDCKVTMAAITAQLHANHLNSTDILLEQSPHCAQVFKKEFDDYELRLQEAIHDLTSLSADLVGFAWPDPFVVLSSVLAM